MVWSVFQLGPHNRYWEPYHPWNHIVQSTPWQSPTCPYNFCTANSLQHKKALWSNCLKTLLIAFCFFDKANHEAWLRFQRNPTLPALPQCRQGKTDAKVIFDDDVDFLSISQYRTIKVTLPENIAAILTFAAHLASFPPVSMLKAQGPGGQPPTSGASKPWTLLCWNMLSD